MFNLSTFFKFNYVFLKKNKYYILCYFFKYLVIKMRLGVIISNNKIFTKNSKTRFFYQMNNFITVIYRTINFVGKTYKILNKKKLMDMKFNRSHVTYLLFNKYIAKKKMSKQKYKYKFFFNKNIKELKNILKQVRKLNIFTLRGIKLSKSIKFKKKGKISTYTM